VVGIGNAYYGMKISQPATRYFVGFSVAIGGWLLLAVVGQILLVLFNQYDQEGKGTHPCPISRQVRSPGWRTRDWCHNACVSSPRMRLYDKASQYTSILKHHLR